ncbi:hypothetical protein M3Y99_00871400 [Aphelenchoides fujianensis]|nr:hypothetical protein M3Y99_00871400 [Aphelenchoides fujianensis]
MLRKSALCFLFIALAAAVPVPRQEIPSCPAGASPMYRPDGEPRRCLPHQANLCLNALDDRADVSAVCCWHNQVDYFCCTGVPQRQCPDYANVTVVIHSGQPMGAHPLKVFNFRKGIEEEFEFAQ